MSEQEPLTVQHAHEWRIAAKNETIASAAAYRRFGNLWIYNVWVHHEWRRRGLGTKIMVSIIAELGDEALYLGVDAFENRPMDNGQLATWYARLGFAMTDVPGIMVRRPR